MNMRGTLIVAISFATFGVLILAIVIGLSQQPRITGHAIFGGIDAISYSTSEFANAKYESDFASKKNIYEIINKYAEKYDISFNLVRAIIKRESEWKHSTQPNSKGAIGIMQIKEIAAEDIKDGACSGFCDNLNIDRKNLEQNIQGGICYLACQKERFGVYNSPEIVIAAYKEGPTAVDKKCITCWFYCKKKNYDECSKRLESATVTYVSDVINNYEDYNINNQETGTKTSSIGGLKVVVDAGHGGNDPGAIGISSSYPEDVITLAIAKELKNQLEQKGIEVIMTRNTDVYPTLKERVSLANNENADLFVSIHANSAKSSPCSASGVEVWSFNSEKSKEISETVVDELSSSMNMNNRGTKTSANLYVLRKTKMPAVLVEVGFICSKNDFAIITNTQKQKQIAKAISEGISKSFA